MDGKPAVEDDPDAILEFTKKKKKKKPVNLDELIASQETPKQENEEKPNDEEDLDELNILKAKKKKKKKKFTMDEGDQEQKTVPVKHESGESGDELMTVAQEEETETEILSKKKKKKPKEVTFVDDDVADLESKDDVDIHVTPGQSSWLGTDRDYTYDELLDRVFDIMMKKNPEMIAGEKKRFVMKPPQCARVGTRKTSFINFTDICSVLHRQPKHCLSFILAELGTSGSIDGNNQLIIKGRFQQKQLESVLRRYIKEYVTCHTCKSPDTVLERKDRLYFLRCNVCQSRCSVASIKSGFQAVTNKRARLRAKAA